MEGVHTNEFKMAGDNKYSPLIASMVARGNDDCIVVRIIVNIINIKQ